MDRKEEDQVHIGGTELSCDKGHICKSMNNKFR